MASVELGTTTQSDSITHGRNLVLAGTRLYAVFADGSNCVYQYSDDDGATWEAEVAIAAGSAWAPTAFYDSVNGRVNFVYGGGNSATAPLRMRAITSNVTSGAPGALTTETVIDAGGANLGVIRPYAFHSATGTNPRYWIIAAKVTAATTYETRVWYVNAGSDADTAGNWATTNFTNLGGNSDAGLSKAGVGAHWTVGGVDKVTLVFSEGSNDVALETVTFDPTAATPTPGTVGTVTGSTHHNPSLFDNGALLAIGVKADYLVVTCFEATTADVNLFKTVDGSTWTQPAGWTDLVMGRHQLALSGSDFYLVYSDTFGAIATTAQTLSYRTITTASDTLSAATAFSDTAGNGIALPLDTGTSKVYALYRASTGSPFSVRSDLLTLTAVQTLLPDADITTTGWTATPLFSKINDSSDATVITATAS